jgi:hypothetical protein
VAREQSANPISFDGSNSQDIITNLQGRLTDSDTSADELSLDYPSAISRTKCQKGENTGMVRGSKFGAISARRREQLPAVIYRTPSPLISVVLSYECPINGISPIDHPISVSLIDVLLTGAIS